MTTRQGHPPNAVPPVYPRVCGGTHFKQGAKFQVVGLSPRVRGNPERLRARRRHHPRSIPACAGEPIRPSPGATRSPVYPRVCGGTSISSGGCLVWSGLSPRVRGNQRELAVHRGRQGSIPACAGEPRRPAPADQLSRVYPRVCGGTIRVHPIANLDRRSIPACAGEPSRTDPALGCRTVYPRVCGGTRSRRATTRAAAGLSPRVRGNRGRGQGEEAPVGSIPACAGEPAPSPPSAHPGTVYPRVCGGTVTSRSARGCRWGLSPRVRGNHRCARPRTRRLRSIPACAGEPSRPYPKRRG